MSEVLDLIKKTAIEAGKLAKDMQATAKVSLKNDSSVVTEGDFAVSELITERTEELWKQGNWHLVDEEQPEKAPHPKEVLNKEDQYIIAVDPIDGTRPYANKLPYYGVSIGVIKNGKPWIGAVNFPALGELFYACGDQAWFHDSNGDTNKITPVQTELGSKSIFFGSEGFTKKRRWNSKHAHMLIAGCAVVNLCFPTIGRGVGSVFKAHVWDFAACWPILKCAGLGLFNSSTKDELVAISPEIFAPGKKFPWLISDPHLCCREQHVSQLLEGIS